MAAATWFLRTWLALATLVAGLAFATSAAAQSDRGQYQILQARYGTAAHNVDVTARLKDLARADNWVQVSNATFGVDPDFNVRKSLRIYARAPDGSVRTFETAEGGSVDGAQFTSWNVAANWGYAGNGGNWEGQGFPAVAADRGEYQILQARYGTADRNMDVTNRLKELARQDRQFRVANNTFGEDPAYGARKSLRIFARDANGGTRTFEYGEGALVDGAVFTGWSGGNWGYGGNGAWDAAANGDRGSYQILHALYGTAAHNMDVTERLRGLARQDTRFQVTNTTFGEDPAYRERKSLRIYARAPDGSTRTFEYGEGATVDGAVFTGWNGGNWGRGAHVGGWEGVNPR